MTANDGDMASTLYIIIDIATRFVISAASKTNKSEIRFVSSTTPGGDSKRLVDIDFDVNKALVDEIKIKMVFAESE